MSSVLLAFALLVLRFAPNWLAIHHEISTPTLDTSVPVGRDVVEKAILSGYSERGLHVIRQARDLRTEITEPTHKIVRWRLLMPAVGNLLALPEWLTLGLAHVGALALTIAILALAAAHCASVGLPLREAAGLAIISGASAPVFTSMGWLGYYDAWLALALVAVSSVKPRWLVALACVLAPWIDERFVLGLPLALMIRAFAFEPAPRESGWTWFRNEAAIPLAVTAVYAVIRLQLAGTGSSQSVGDYLDRFVFSERISIGQRLYGAWEGLRFGWLIVMAAVISLLWSPLRSARRQAGWLVGGIVSTTLVGLLTAQDLSRSMVLIVPAVPVAWILVSRQSWWAHFHLTPVLAAAAWVIPAYHVTGDTRVPVDHFWSPSRAQLTAQNNLGNMYATGRGIAPNDAEATKWFRKAAEQGFGDAQYNLGLMYANGRGVPRDASEAAKWIARAAEQGVVDAQSN